MGVNQQSSENSTNPNLPQWWRDALALEAAGKMQQAEKLIMDTVKDIGAPASAAELWKLHMQRLLKLGDTVSAKAAFDKASDLIYFYASCATSGGEGVALSRERDEFIRELVKAFGGDPRK